MWGLLPKLFMCTGTDAQSLADLAEDMLDCEEELQDEAMPGPHEEWQSISFVSGVVWDFSHSDHICPVSCPSEPPLLPRVLLPTID